MKSLKPQLRAFNAYQARVSILNEQLIRKIEELPDNPGIIKRSGLGCFVLSSKALGTDNWTQFYHDFKLQYKFLRAIIENYDINQVERIFQEIITTGAYRQSKPLKTTDGYTFDSRTNYKFHPDVLTILKENL